MVTFTIQIDCDMHNVSFGIMNRGKDHQMKNLINIWSNYQINGLILQAKNLRISQCLLYLLAKKRVS